MDLEGRAQIAEAQQRRPIAAEDHSFRLREEPVDHPDEVTRLDACVSVTVGEAEKIERACCSRAPSDDGPLFDELARRECQE
jgi:hypothetical protein